MRSAAVRLAGQPPSGVAAEASPGGLPVFLAPYGSTAFWQRVRHATGPGPSTSASWATSFARAPSGGVPRHDLGLRGMADGRAEEGHGEQDAADEYPDVRHAHSRRVPPLRRRRLRPPRLHRSTTRREGHDRDRIPSPPQSLARTNSITRIERIVTDPASTTTATGHTACVDTGARSTTNTTTKPTPIWDWPLRNSPQLEGIDSSRDPPRTRLGTGGACGRPHPEDETSPRSCGRRFSR
jgi:hypothetical protein